MATGGRCGVIARWVILFVGKQLVDAVQAICVDPRRVFPISNNSPAHSVVRTPTLKAKIVRYQRALTTLPTALLSTPIHQYGRL